MTGPYERIAAQEKLVHELETTREAFAAALEEQTRRIANELEHCYRFSEKRTG